MNSTSIRAKLRHARRFASEVIPRVAGPAAKIVRVAGSASEVKKRRLPRAPASVEAVESHRLARDGYLTVAADQNVLHMLETAREIRDLSDATEHAGSKKFFKQLLTEDLLATNPIFMDVALDSRCLDIVAGAMGTTPYLESVELLLTLPETGPLSQSQYFHCDRVDSAAYKQVIYVNDVDDDEGPFSFFPRPQSSAVPKWLPHYIPDDEMRKHVDFAELVQWKGAAGSRMLVDVRHCFHFGSRARRPRLAFFAYYNTGYGYYKRMRSWQGSFVESLDLTAQQRHALGLL